MKNRVIQYLMLHYSLTEEKARIIVDKYPEEIERAMRWASEAYYPANRIAHEEGLVHIEKCLACQKELQEEELQENF